MSEIVERVGRAVAAVEPAFTRRNKMRGADQQYEVCIDRDPADPIGDETIGIVEAFSTQVQADTAAARITEELRGLAAIEAHKAALDQAGYVIVPREPTEAMIAAGDAVLDAGPSGSEWYVPSEKPWRAMICAAPKV